MLRIGILDCDHLAPELQARWGLQYSTMFTKVFLTIDSTLSFRTWSAVDGDLPDDFSQADAWLITGSKHDAFGDTPWVVALRDWIVKAHNAKVPLVGVCFGHQAIAKALGAQVGRSEKGWGVGFASPALLQAEPWMQPPVTNAHLDVIVSHQDQVQSLPTGARCMASSDFCPIFMYQIGQHILAIQGHPEFSKDYDRDLLNLRRESLDPIIYESAIQSLEEKSDSDTLMRWILNFIRMPRAHLA